MNSPSKKRAVASVMTLILAGLVVLSYWAGPRADSSDASTLGKAPRPAPKALYWGATIGEQFTGESAPWDKRAISAFESKVGKQASLLSFNVPFADCSSGKCVPYSFPSTPLENAREHGSIPIVSWSSDSSPPKVNQAQYQLSDLVAGHHDAYIRDWAQKAKRWGHPFFLRFDWEMNGFWFPWGADANGNSPSQFVAAWRHVHKIFDSVGATNATWVWCPNVDFTRKLATLKSVYPGNRWVDWTCLDGFNWGRRPDSVGWQTFDEIYKSTYRRVVALAPKKPMFIGEVASNTIGGSKAAWIKQMLSRLATGYPKIAGFVWFDVIDGTTHWPIETTASATKAFRKGISRATYRSNVYRNIDASPIRPPSR